MSNDDITQRFFRALVQEGRIWVKKAEDVHTNEEGAYHYTTFRGNVKGVEHRVIISVCRIERSQGEEVVWIKEGANLRHDSKRSSYRIEPGVGGKILLRDNKFLYRGDTDYCKRMAELNIKHDNEA